MSLTIKLKRPVSMVEVDQEGIHDSGWKSLIDKHSLTLHLNLPFGVIINILGGLNGYCCGNTSLP